jgi:hypothetical protein
VSVLHIAERHLGRGLGHKWLEIAVDISDIERRPAATLNGNSKARGAASDLLFRKWSSHALPFPCFQGKAGMGLHA